eukprot:scaffold19336_cov16-Tisochrysis_lutea.AAC.4
MSDCYNKEAADHAATQSCGHTHLRAHAWIFTEKECVGDKHGCCCAEGPVGGVCMQVVKGGRAPACCEGEAVCPNPKEALLVEKLEVEDVLQGLRKRTCPACQCAFTGKKAAGAASKKDAGAAVKAEGADEGAAGASSPQPAANSSAGVPIAAGVFYACERKRRKGRLCQTKRP